MQTKEEILGNSFYPHDCGGMIDCVTKQDALKAMDEYAEQVSSEYVDWIRKEDYVSRVYDDVRVWRKLGQTKSYSNSELYKMFLEQRSKK
jgi:hypothetical protein